MSRRISRTDVIAFVVILAVAVALTSFILKQRTQPKTMAEILGGPIYVEKLHVIDSGTPRGISHSELDDATQKELARLISESVMQRKIFPFSLITDRNYSLMLRYEDQMARMILDLDAGTNVSLKGAQIVEGGATRMLSGKYHIDEESAEQLREILDRIVPLE